MPEYLFVYGTLRQELVEKTSAELVALMQSLRFISTGTIRGQLYDLGDYPGAIVGDEFATSIVGEIYEMPEPQAAFALLDRYESFIPGELEASLFARIKTPVTLPAGQPMECWLYVYNDWVLNGRLIADGDYVAYLKTRS
ncbi:MAG TPA: gamma-glutamylcyclotransferase family protein [Blastocatellia bacterium]|nr:gamma-glutamylcyclotransferase family protein [Blastocatellia bacterium]